MDNSECWIVCCKDAYSLKKSDKARFPITFFMDVRRAFRDIVLNEICVCNVECKNYRMSTNF